MTSTVTEPQEVNNSTAGTGGSGRAKAITDEYGDIHKLVLQGMMSAGFLDAKGVKKLFIAACSYLSLPSNERTSMAYVQKVVRDICEKIRPFDMAIRSASCELTGKKYYIFLLTVDKPLLKLQTLFSKFEVGLFQKIIDTVLRKYPSFTVPFSECINLASEVEARGNLEHAEGFILKMIDLNYLAKYPLGGEDFNVTMGIRGIRELETVLRDCYFDVMGKCSLCKMLLLHGYLCPHCRLVLHRPCYIRYTVNVSTCPNCSCSWSDKSKMLNRVRDEEEMDYDINFSSQRQSAATSRRRNLDDTSPPDLDVASPLDVDSPVVDDVYEMPKLSRMTLNDSVEKTSKEKPKRNRRRIASSSDESNQE